MAKQPTISVALKLPARQHQRLFESAKARGFQPSVYAQLLFEAAFAARIGQERGEAPADAELDRQVTLVFCCAGHCDTVSIARATGVPEHRVQKILDAWKSFARAA